MTGTAVVAGVGPLLGAAVAREFAAAGWSVGLFARSSDVTEPLAAELRETGGEAIAVSVDVTDPAAVEAGFETVREKLGPVEVLVHNASVTSGGSIDSADPESFERVWRVRAYGGYLCVREALPDLRATAGTVIFSGTSYAQDGPGRMIDWTSGAAATRALARSLAEYLAEDGVQVTYASIAASVASEGDTRGATAVWDHDVAETYRHLAENDSAMAAEIDIRPRG